MGSWIFVSSGAMEVFEERIRAKIWPVFKTTSNRNQIRVGDRIVFYKAGKDGKRFIGSAEVGSELIDSEDGDFKIKLNNTDVWKKGVLITDVLMELDFIKNKAAWSNYLVGGIRKMSDKSFEYLVRNH